VDTTLILAVLGGGTVGAAVGYVLGSRRQTARPVHTDTSQVTAHTVPEVVQNTAAEVAHRTAAEVVQHTAAEVVQTISTQSQALHDATVSRIQSDTADIAIRHSVHISGLIGGLRTATEDLSTQTNYLEDALRSNINPGNWGVMQLERLVKLSGMQENVYFAERKHATDTRSRQVMVVRFANKAQLTVDMSMPLDAFFAGVTARDPERAVKAKELYDGYRHHIDVLSQWNTTGDASNLPFIVMYIQVEGSLMFAAEGQFDQESIIDYASRHKIIIATPGTMMSLLLTAQFSWDQRLEIIDALEFLHNVEELKHSLKPFLQHYAAHSHAMAETFKHLDKIGNTWNINVLPKLARAQTTYPRTSNQSSGKTTEL
jgi:DNA recombination protein RmuC